MCEVDYWASPCVFPLHHFYKTKQWKRLGSFASDDLETPQAPCWFNEEFFKFPIFHFSWLVFCDAVVEIQSVLSNVLTLTLFRVFEYFILLNIVANCVVLALNKPLPENDKIEMSEALVSKRNILHLLVFFHYSIIHNGRRTKS